MLGYAAKGGAGCRVGNFVIGKQRERGLFGNVNPEREQCCCCCDNQVIVGSGSQANILAAVKTDSSGFCGIFVKYSTP